ncbi:unnamed protein product [Merluccius merluccius]
MMSPVTKAMVEAYALMIMVMGTFFIYFCGMVWAFCNPVLSGGEEDEEDEMLRDAHHKINLWQMAPNPQEVFCTGVDPEQLQHQHQHRDTRDWLAQTTYINFGGGDTDSLLLDRNDFGFADHVRESKTWGSPV